MNLTDPIAVADPKSSAKSARREAIGAEIPVTVHASRTNQGLGKNLPSVHEDTKTVIVLQQGAVVRMTASLSTGETVVLTNRMTGADVLCRVGNIKSQSGIQHYVDMEFMQRAPGFWGDTVAAASAPLAADTSVAAPVPTTLPALAPPAIVLNPVAVLPAPPAAIVQPAASVAPAQPLSAPAAILPMPEPAPSTNVAPALQPVQLETAPLAEPAAPAQKTFHAAPPIPIFTTAPSFGGVQPETYSGNSSGSKKALLGAAAALLLVLSGAGGGYWFFSRQSNDASSPSMQQAAVPSPDLTTISTPAMEPEPSAALSAAASEPPMNVVIESRPVEEPPPARIQPAPAASARTPVPPASRRSVVTIEQLKAPKAKTAAPRSDAGDPMPMMLGANNLGETAAAGTLLATAAVAPAPPPAVGGQLQQPQLLSSTAAAYPATARAQRIQGTVVLDALVDETGKVVETKVIVGPAPLLQAAQDAVRTWKYKPAQLNGRPITVHTRVSIRFSLQ